MTTRKPVTPAQTALGCGCLLAAVVLLAVAGWGIVHTLTSSDPPRPAALGHPLPEHLTFSGQVTGTLTEGLDARAHSTRDPQPISGVLKTTGCTDSPDEWEADIYGTVAGSPVTLRLSIDTTSNLTVVGAQQIGIYAASSPQAELAGANLDLTAGGAGAKVFTVNPDRQSGTIDMTLTDGFYGHETKETITGSWTCGPVQLPPVPKAS